jgi:glycerophosphoryl diester phosphodiesterase
MNFMGDPRGMKRAEQAGFLIIGHRGACAYAPENTVASIEEAIARGADMVEFDLRRTADGVVVLFHDRIARSLSGKTVSVSKIPFDELSATARSEGYEIATLEQVLGEFGARIAFDIEIKVRGFEEEVIRLLDRYPPSFRPIISSFVPGVVRKIRKLRHSSKTGLIIGYSRIPQLNIFARPVIGRLISEGGADSIHLHKSLVSERVMKKLKAMGAEVHIWTVNDPEEMKRLLGMGVDGIVTDKPDLLYDLCRSMAEVPEAVIGEARLSSGRFAYTGINMRKG